MRMHIFYSIQVSIVAADHMNIDYNAWIAAGYNTMLTREYSLSTSVIDRKSVV